MSEKDKLMLKQMLKLTPKQQKTFVDDADNEYILFLCECVLNALEGNVRISVAELQPFEKSLRILRRKSTSYWQRRKTLKSNSGLKILKLIGKPCTNYLDLCHGS